MLRFIYILTITIAFSFTGCESPNFSEENPNDAGSDSFVPDTVQNLTIEIIRRLDFPYYVNDVVELSWTDASEFEDGYKVFRRGPADENQLVAELPPNSSFMTDTVKRGGNYTYEVQATYKDSAGSAFKTVNVSHVIETNPMNTDKHWYGSYVTPLTNFEYLVLCPNVNSRIKPEIYNFRTNTWRIVEFPGSADASVSYLQPEHNILLTMDIYGFFYYNVNTRKASSKQYFSDRNNSWDQKHFRSVYFDDENVLIITSDGKGVYLFNPLKQTLFTLKSMNFEHYEFSLIKVSETEALVVGGQKIEKFNLTDRSWETLSDLGFTLNHPRTIKLNENEVIIYNRDGNYPDTKFPIYRYDFRDQSYQEVAHLNGSPKGKHFKLDNGNVMIFTNPVYNTSYSYQIYDPSNNEVTRPTKSFIERDPLNFARLPNGAHLIPTSYYKAYIFRVDSE